MSTASTTRCPTFGLDDGCGALSMDVQAVDASARKRRRDMSDDDDEAEDCGDAASPEPTSKTLTAETLQRHMAARKKGDPEARKASTPQGKVKATATSAVASSGDGGGGERQVHKLQAKAALAKDIKQIYQDYSGKRSMYASLKKRAETVEAEVLSQLMSKPSDVLQAIETSLLAPLKALDDEMPTLHLSQVDSKTVLFGITEGGSMAHPGHN